jgi:hypothetical protein
MATRVVIHIGLEKTGTTSIQHFLATNAALLHEHGWLYPLAGRINSGHHAVAFALGFSTIRHDHHVLTDLARELQAWPGAAVLSSENFSINVTDLNVRKLRAALAGVTPQVQIVVYYRAKNEWLQSLYLERKRWGLNKDFHAFAQATVAEYERLPELWRAEFGDALIIRRFEKKNDVVTDFTNLLGLSGSLPQEQEIRLHQTPRDKLEQLSAETALGDDGWGWSVLEDHR